MKREKISLFVGLTLLVITFIAAAYNIWSRSSHEADASKTIIRIAHWQLEPPVRAAFEKIAKVYMDEHPGVTVEVIPVPERTYSQWFMTRLVGGFAPDLIEIRNSDAALTARYFIPLTEWLDAPNPYNTDTPVEKLSWRNTFIDGLDNDAAYHAQLLDYYSVPVSQFTSRLIYNKTLWRELLGDRPLPKTYEEFKQMCADFNVAAKKSGRNVVPLLASNYHSAAVFNRLGGSLSSNMSERLRGSPLNTISTSDLGLEYIRGQWNFDTPEVFEILKIMRDSSELFQSGFDAISREDAVFKFLQGGALSIYTGSWDYGSFQDQAGFELGVFNLPIPEPGSAGFGKFVKGQTSEGSVATGANFSLARQSKNPAVAIDFLQFLTSQRGNRIFADASRWLPAVIGVEPSDELKPFYPVLVGVRNGIDLGTLGAANAGRIVISERYRLTGPTGSVEAFRDALKEKAGDAMREDLKRAVIQQNKVVQRQDGIIAAFNYEAKLNPKDERALRKMRENEESQTLLESLSAWTALNLAEPVK